MLEVEDWGTEYSKLIHFLECNSSSTYRSFQKKITFLDNIIGVKTPILKRIAKEIAKTNYYDFFKMEKKSYEEIVIHGLVIGYASESFDETLKNLDKFLVYNNNWAINDIVCANMKQFKNNQEKGYKYIKKLLQSGNDWNVRFGIVLIINFYINDIYIDDVLKSVIQISSSNYYVKMAIAWLLSKCYVYYKTKTIDILGNVKLNCEIRKMAIRKILDSRIVPKFEKDNLKKRYKN